MLQPANGYFFLNGSWISVSDYASNQFSEGITIYEVIRVIDGIPLFIEEHLNRLELSAQLIKFDLWLSHKDIERAIYSLIDKNSNPESNIQLFFHHKAESNSQNFVCRFIQTHYPEKNAYINGVKSMLFAAERKNPRVKKTDQSLRSKADHAISINEVYEVILINHKYEITEGSRSNIFFIQGKTILTPLKKNVLAGVTRQKVIQLCKENNMECIEQDVKSNYLSNFDAAFFTGTSPKVLPVKSIGQINFDPGNDLLKRLIKLYDDEIERYIKLAKSGTKKL
ncbi:MAG: aminotransferase class IV [Bacteroidetes bacterium]|nr:aminotransferase class IV [Bacteroidota bacterium]